MTTIDAALTAAVNDLRDRFGTDLSNDTIVKLLPSELQRAFLVRRRAPSPKVPRLAPASDGCVYVIGDPASSGPVKIGTTTDLAARLAAIRGGRGAIVPDGVDRRRLEVLAHHDGGRDLERRLHRFYASRRLVGEWFALPVENAHNVLLCCLADEASAESVQARGVACHCWICLFKHPPEQKPGDRPEWDTAGEGFVAVVSAITHTRLGVDLADSWAGFPASHCDIDRAVRLLEALRYARVGDQ